MKPGGRDSENRRTRQGDASLFIIYSHYQQYARVYRCWRADLASKPFSIGPAISYKRLMKVVFAT